MLREYLQAVAPHLPSALISAACYRRICAIAAGLPALSMVGFEAALGEDDAEVDFAVAVRHEFQEHERFVAWHRGSGTPDTMLQSVARLCAASLNPDSQLFDRVGTIWLEYDTATSGSADAVPNLLLGVRPDTGSSRAPKAGLATDALHLLLSRAVPEAVQSLIVRCYAALSSPGMVLFQVGAMGARDLDAFRVCVVGRSGQQLQEYLAAIDWPGSIEQVAEVLGWLQPYAFQLALGLDVGTQMSPRIGIECYADPRREPVVSARWRALLHRLVDLGLCRPEKRDGMLAWPGVLDASFHQSPAVIRGLNHVKIVCGPDREPMAKAYFGFVRASPQY